MVLEEFAASLNGLYMSLRRYWRLTVKDLEYRWKDLLCFVARVIGGILQWHSKGLGASLEWLETALEGLRISPNVLEWPLNISRRTSNVRCFYTYEKCILSFKRMLFVCEAKGSFLDQMEWWLGLHSVKKKKKSFGNQKRKGVRKVFQRSYIYLKWRSQNKYDLW